MSDDEKWQQLQREASERFADMADMEILKNIRFRLLESWGEYPESWSADLIDIQRLIEMNVQLLAASNEQPAGGGGRRE